MSIFPSFAMMSRYSFRSRYAFVTCSLVICSCLLFVSAVAAQDHSSQTLLQGKVTDQSGAEVPDAVILLDPDSGRPHIPVKASAQGAFEFRIDNAKKHVLQISRQGFKTKT